MNPGKLIMSMLALFSLGSGPELGAEPAGSILMVVTSHDRIDADHATGLWLEEFAVPYELFREARYDVTVASTRGGAAPVDPRSREEQKRFQAKTLAALETTVPLAEVELADFAAVFFPGGHGTMYDLPEDPSVARTVSHFLGRGLPIALVCHGPAALVGAKGPDGKPVVAGRKVTGFTNDEERAVELDSKMPFLLETRLRELGGEFTGAANFSEHVIEDGNLITGQNPASSAAAARAVLGQLAP